jgi:hypothetical protein
MRRADARSAQIRSPDGVTRCFQVSAYSVEPSEAVLARNLFSKDDCRAALFDEKLEGWPQMTLISSPASFACRGERLARAGSCPNRPVVGPTGEPECVGPDADSCEEMALGKPVEFVWYDILDRPFVDFAGRYQPRLD